MKFIQQLSLAIILSLCATQAFADGPDSATINFTGSIKVPPCQIQTPRNVQVPMGNIPLSAFSGKGTDDKEWADFTVSMTCPAGIKALSYKLDPAGGSQIYDAAYGVMTLSNKGGASGVGVRVADRDKSDSVPLGQDISLGDKYDPSKFGQTININFEAIYYQTEDQIKGGEADALATFTLSYE
ncbi:fimbrial protein (plasmid) [Burkholderia pyrrocinia]|uniref:fimbrial protein n=1 Tax=Burkholderia pyrrocinia TaxID=60550 RepID=UPI0038B4B384